MHVWHRNSKKKSKINQTRIQKKNQKNNQKNQNLNLVQNQKSKIKKKSIEKTMVFFDCNQNPMLREGVRMLA